ncbi:ras-related protein Rab-44 isoform X1 [Taeniopygia guttata]|uniref:ras-related protein Rab-44 isoform X1 n=1 Tax=Taeniopygia guttata TaxID=59729 RepID=UPI003BB95D3C
MEEHSSTNMELLAEVEADLQVWNEVGSPGTQQGRGVDPGVQLEKDKPEVGLGEEMGAAAGHCEGPSPAEAPVGSPGLCGLFPGKSPALELVEADLQISGGPSPEKPQGGEGEGAVQLQENEEEDGAGQDEHRLPHEPVPHPSAVTLGQGEGAGVGLQLRENAESLDTAEEQGTGAKVQLSAEGDELRLTPGGSTEADLQPLGEAGSSGTEQGRSVDLEVQPLDQEDKEELLERKAEDVQEDRMFTEGPSPGAPWGGEGERAVQLEEEKEEEDEAKGQGEHELPHKPVLDLHGSGVRQGEGADEDMQAQEEAESLDTTEDQSTGANVQLSAEGNELRLTPGGSTEADLQPLGEAGTSGAEQGERLDPEVQPLDQGDKAELVEGEAEGAQADLQLSEGLSSGGPWGGEIGTNIQIEEKDDEAQGQGEHELPHEPVLDLHVSGVRQGEGADEDMQAQEETESLDTAEDQSTGANVQMIAEGNELKSTSGERPEADLQPLIQTDSMGTEQGGNVAPDVHPLDQGDEAETVKVEAEDSWADTQLSAAASSESPQGGGHCALVPRDGAGDWRQGQGGREQMKELVPDLSAVTIRQRRGTDAGVQPVEEDVILDTVGGQSTGASVQLSAEGDELRLTPGGSTEADLQHLGEAGSSGTEQGGSVDPEVHPLDQGDKAELVEGEAEGAQADLRLSEGLSPGGPWGGEWGTVLHSEEDEEGEAQVQGENGLPQESVLSPEGAQGRQGEGAGAGLEPQEAAENLHTLKAQSADTDVQLFTDQQMPKSGSGGSTEADLTPLGVAGLWKGEQGLTLGLEAVLGPSPTANPWEGAAAADVPPPIEAALCPEPATPAEGPGLEAKLGACIGPEGQILEAQELLQGERAPAEGQPLDGAHSLEAAQGERLEAEVRNGVKTQGLELNQGHDDAELASLVSEVLSQLSPLKRETMMQEDVLIPDVWRLCAPGLAAQRELQEQVSAQGHEGRLHTVAQQPEGETPPMMEPEHTAAGPAEHPKQEVPPASTLHTAMQPGDAGSDQLGVVLRKNSLGQRQLLGEQSKDLSVGQREKMQEFGQKMSQEGEPSSGEPGAVTACGAGAAPRGCPKAALDPDHLYNVLFIGDSHVGKTSFLYRLHADTFNPHLTATVGLDYQIKTLVVDNERFALRLWDSAGQERYRSVTRQFFRKADGVVLMYDITSELSFSDVRFWLSCIQEGAEDGVAVLLLGNKSDCAAQRQVPTKEGECLAKEHQLMFYECSAASGHNVFESMASFTRLLRVREDELKNKAEEVPKAPQKKKGCCW